MLNIKALPKKTKEMILPPALTLLSYHKPEGLIAQLKNPGKRPTSHWSLTGPK